jgi:hypothetical protein
MSWREHRQVTVPKTVGVLEEHINKTFAYPQDVASLLVQPQNLTKAECKRHGQEDGVGNVHENVYENNQSNGRQYQSNLHDRVWGQCSPSMMQSKLDFSDQFDTKSTACDYVWLLQETQGITHRFKGIRNIFVLLDHTWSSYYAYREGRSQTLRE